MGETKERKKKEIQQVDKRKIGKKKTQKEAIKSKKETERES